MCDFLLLVCTFLRIKYIFLVSRLYVQSRQKIIKVNKNTKKEKEFQHAWQHYGISPYDFFKFINMNMQDNFKTKK